MQVEQELIEYRKLKSEIYPKIEKLWMYDSSFPLSEKDMAERAKLIEWICYKVSNEWISDEETYEELYERSFGKKLK